MCYVIPENYGFREKPLTSCLLFSSGVKSGNAQFSQDIVAWTFQETLVLRIDSATHHRVNETEAPASYTVNDNIVSYRSLLFNIQNTVPPPDI